MSNNFIDKVYNFARKNGALGGKVIGAGGGGFLILIVNKQQRKQLQKKLVKFKLNEFEWNFYMNGISTSKL